MFSKTSAKRNVSIDISFNISILDTNHDIHLNLLFQSIYKFFLDAGCLHL